MAYGDSLTVKVVAMEGGVEDWAAYVGPGEWSDDRVAREGMKIGESSARDLFGRMVDQGGRDFCKLSWRD